MSIPELPSYDTDGTPDASFRDASTFKYENSKPGLYESDCTFANSSKESVKFGKDGCYDIWGSYRNGKTSVFTQTNGLDLTVLLTVKDAHTLEVCKRPDAR